MVPSRTVLITGASSGFGRGVALRLAEQGFNLVLAARRGHLLEEIARECGGDVLTMTVDVGEPADMEKLGRAALAKFPRIDVWINNAGVAALGPFDAIPLRDHQRVLQTTLGGVVNGSHVALRHFRRMQSGTLINVASMLGRTPAPYYASYCAAKYGVVGLSDALRQEVRAAGLDRVRVCTVLPMAADTPFFDHAANYTGHSLRAYPLADADEVVDAIVGLVARPQDEVTVGLTATAAVAAERFLPSIAHAVSGALQHGLQMEEAPPADVSEGNLHAPLAIGTGVHGTIRARIQAEEGR
ncbi:SDR family NAD(P)-dependent oxidoreductase [Coralloluteibacterium thermophilus]|uniref:SDR family NAD(P)-dependent oxidoreductase n=1 Tax=Coralloluteibacterium thermophilum TaxID=2707049 RepID=A0ABV9NPG3_9GAMM